MDSALAGIERPRPSLLARGRTIIVRLNWSTWIVLGTLILVWQYYGSRPSANSLLIVPPTEVFDRGVELWQAGRLGSAITASGTAYIIGLILGGLGGTIVGLVAGNWKAVARVLDPLMSAAYAVPIIALAPLFIILLGIGIAPKILIVALSVFFPVAITTTGGVRAMDVTYRELGAAFSHGPLSVLVKIVLPASVPYILSGVRVGIARGLNGVLGGELFGARDGLGLLVFNAARSFDTAAVFVGVVLFAFAGITLSALAYKLEARVAPWRAL